MSDRGGDIHYLSLHTQDAALVQQSELAKRLRSWLGSFCDLRTVSSFCVCYSTAYKNKEPENHQS